MENVNPHVEAHVIKPPRIRIGSKKEVDVTEGTFQIRNELFEKGTIKDWLVIYSSDPKGYY